MKCRRIWETPPLPVETAAGRFSVVDFGTAGFAVQRRHKSLCFRLPAANVLSEGVAFASLIERTADDTACRIVLYIQQNVGSRINTFVSCG